MASQEELFQEAREAEALAMAGPLLSIFATPIPDYVTTPHWRSSQYMGRAIEAINLYARSEQAVSEIAKAYPHYSPERIEQIRMVGHLNLILFTNSAFGDAHYLSSSAEAFLLSVLPDAPVAQSLRNSRGLFIYADVDERLRGDLQAALGDPIDSAFFQLDHDRQAISFAPNAQALIASAKNQHSGCPARKTRIHHKGRDRNLFALFWEQYVTNVYVK